ncbi:MAG: hypothetical protein JXA54_07085 [Candidatus Heimdallarchaeota archaeon]|nr:hypothetical protein [Candidatus Heimdallarchaeota archaeon]
MTDDGEEIKVESGDMKINNKTCAIIVSHTHRCIYVFKGSKISIVQKFAVARRASAVRLQQGYRIRHIEQIEGIDEEFQPILDFLGGLHEDIEVIPKETPVKIEVKKESIQPKLEATPIEKETSTLAAKTATNTDTTKTITKPKSTAKPKTTTKTKSETEDLSPKLAKVIKTMMELDPPEISSCDYVIIENKLYILVGEDKSDLRKGKFSLEEVVTLPEGVFPVENYYPRILIASQKVLGIELWARR